MKLRFCSQRGVTFVELMITVVIIGIVSAMAAPRFQRIWERVKVRASDREMVSTLRLARSKAITDKEQYGVYFDQANRSVTLFKDLANPSAMTFEGGDSVIRVDTLPTEFTYMGTDMINNVLVFLPNGSAGFTGGGNVFSLAVTPQMVAIIIHNVLASTGRVHSYSSIY
ncbi:MAG TPA: GspH/FimT family pseudopilin [Candidatus Deferrimicrobium sp.]|nr:GspH/FimT family pseudopilin [Candidatus Deferrimicrobium sp.]